MTWKSRADKIKYMLIIIVTFRDVVPRIEKWSFSGLNCSSGFPDLFPVALKSINSFLRFLHELSKKYQIP